MSESSRRVRNWFLRFPFSLLDWLPADESKTVTRLGKSRHVGDLRAIFLGAVIIGIALILLVLCWKGNSNDSEKTITAIVTAAGAVIAWTYQTGGKRLGVVDLVASEIVTLCRVGTLAEAVPNFIKQYEAIGQPPTNPGEPVRAKSAAPARQSGPATTQTGSSTAQNGAAGTPSRFSSQENYFPVFEHNNTDLQVLEARVLRNITGFYTYMKAARDTLRSFTEVRAAHQSADAQRHALINVFYMIFLAYEAGRSAVNDLIEYEPTHAEAVIVLLFTEMQAFRFLLDKFPADDVRGKRLNLRRQYYPVEIEKVSAVVTRNSRDPKWEKSATMLPDLVREYNEMKFGRPVAVPELPS